MLARVFISALDIAEDADFAQKNWASALRRVDALLEVKRTLKRPAEDIAGDRANRAKVLVQLGRFDEARSELEDCLHIFQHDPARRASVRSSLAALFNKQGDVAQAVIQQRRALALHEALPDSYDRAISHGNLAIHLNRSDDDLAACAEASRHQLAAFIYFLVAGLGQDLQTLLHNYAIDFRRARAAGIELVVPRVAELIADPAFDSLKRWLQQRQVDITELQAAVDQILKQVRQAVLKQE